MATPLADALFWIAAFAILVAQGAILRSTARAMRGTAVRSPVLEWCFAVGPAIALVVLLALTWRTMHPEQLRGSGVAPSVSGPRT